MSSPTLAVRDSGRVSNESQFCLTKGTFISVLLLKLHCLVLVFSGGISQ